jgi:hypothetical protein
MCSPKRDKHIDTAIREIGEGESTRYGQNKAIAELKSAEDDTGTFKTTRTNR